MRLLLRQAGWLHVSLSLGRSRQHTHASPAPPATPPPFLTSLYSYRTHPLQDQGFVWIRNVFTEKPVVKGAESCGNKLCSGTPATICPFVKVCAEGQAPALLTASTNGQCTYAECGQASALSPTVPSPTVAGTGTTNGAAAVAPALMLALALAAAVQLLF